MPHPLKSRRGTSMVEFVLHTVPLLFVSISLVWMAMGVWEYHTLVQAVDETARYAAFHGADCVGQSCATTVEQVANTLAGKAIGIPAGNMNVTLTSSAHNYTCNPLSNCQSNSSAWPTLAGNTAYGAGGGTNISITATYQFTSAISMWVPIYGKMQFAGVTLGANSTQPVLY
jgi:Flp pilus assembly protein TadG